MRRPRSADLAVAFIVAALPTLSCSGQDGPATADAGSPDAASACTSPLGNPGAAVGLGPSGFSSLASLPVAGLCAKAPGGAGGTLTASAPCDGFTFVVLNDQGDCWWMWLYEQTTGNLVALAASCNTSFECAAASPGFRFPTGCFAQGIFTGADLCADAGIIADAGFDAGGG